MMMMIIMIIIIIIRENYSSAVYQQLNPCMKTDLVTNISD